MKVYIAGAKRTAIGSFLGGLSSVSAADLGASVIADALKQSRIPKEEVNEVILGNVLSAGQGQGVARQASIKAGLNETIPAYAVNMVCGSGLKAVMNAYTSINAGTSQVVIAGGTESMSQAPFNVSAKMRHGNKMGNMSLEDSLLNDGLTDAFAGYHMGITAENIVEKYDISREQQDQFAIASQEKAIHAVDSGLFEAEITPITVKNRKSETIVDVDEYPNRTTSLEKLSTLRAAFKKEGTVTAGNASGINDGASATVIIGEKKLAELDGIKPLVEIIAVGQGGVAPEVMGLGPTPAIQMALKQANLTLADMDVIELNEAFAAQSLGVIHELAELYEMAPKEILDKTNVNGGAIALGHPLGASGNRILVTLIHIMKKKNLAYGLASLCIGGGMGVAVVLKNSQ